MYLSFLYINGDGISDSYENCNELVTLFLVAINVNCKYFPLIAVMGGES